MEDGFRQVAGGNKHAMKTLESKLTGVCVCVRGWVWCGVVWCGVVWCGVV